MNKIALFLDRKVIERSRFKTFVQLVSREILLGCYLVKSNRVKPILREVIAGNVSRDCERERKGREKKERKKKKVSRTLVAASTANRKAPSISILSPTIISISISVRARFPSFAHTRLYLAVFHDKQIERICWK